MDRRKFLQTTGATAATLTSFSLAGCSFLDSPQKKEAPVSTGTETQRTPSEEPQQTDTPTQTPSGRVVDLGEEGLSDGAVIDSYLENHFRNDTEVHIPAGTYEWRGDGLDVTENAALIGNGEVVFEIDGFELQENIVAESGTVLIQNITQTGTVTEGCDSRIAAWAEGDGVLVLENVNRPDGQSNGAETTGFFVPPQHSGTVVFRNCTVNRSNNGIYASTPKKRGNGRVVVDGGLFKNNNVAAVRVGSDESVVRRVTVHNDAPIPEDCRGTTNGRGIWVRKGGENIVIERCDLTFRDRSRGSTGIIMIQPEDGGGSGRITDCRLWSGVNSDPIQIDDSVADSWSGSGIYLCRLTTRFQANESMPCHEHPFDRDPYLSQWVSCCSVRCCGGGYL